MDTTIIILIVFVVTFLCVLAGVIMWNEHKAKKIKSKVGKDGSFITNSLGIGVGVIVLIFLYKIGVKVIDHNNAIPAKKTTSKKQQYIKGQVVNQSKELLCGAYVYISYDKYDSKKYFTDSQGRFTIPVDSNADAEVQLCWGYMSYKENRKHLTLASDIQNEELLNIVDIGTPRQTAKLKSIIITSNLSDSIGKEISTTLNKMIPYGRSVNHLHLDFTYTKRDILVDFSDNTEEYHHGGRVLVLVGSHSFELESPELQRVQRKDASLVQQNLRDQVRDIVKNNVPKICNNLKSYVQ